MSTRVHEGYDQSVRAHLASLVEEFRRHDRHTAVVLHRGNRRYATTHAETAQLAGRFASELEEHGVSAGERVVLWGENSAEWISAYFGCLLRGVLAVPLDAAGSSAFVERVVKDVAPKLIVGDAPLLGKLNDRVPRLLLSEMRGRLPEKPMFRVSDTVHERAAFQIIFTSGTTSQPKGIVHTHRNVLASLEPIESEINKYRKYERWVRPLRFLHTLPLSHVFGQFMGLWVPPLLGAEVHFGERRDPAGMVEVIRRERISVLAAVPRVLQLLRTHLLGRFSGLREEVEGAQQLTIWKRWWRFRRVHHALGWKFWAVISGGASLPAELELFWHRLGFALIQGYGMTETAALVTLNHPLRIAQGTIGKALPGREVRLSDEGEILVRGDIVAGSIWEGGALQPRQGEWLATGDLALQSESGDLRFLGRKSDVVVTAAGMNVHPADLEAAMTNQRGVRGCVVVPCETVSGNEPVSVVLFSGSAEELQSAVSAANYSLAEYQKIRRVLQWPELDFPYTSTGKVLRKQVRAWACQTLAGQPGRATASENGDELVDLVAEVTGERLKGAHDGLSLSDDLHLDSLGRVQLQSMLEQRLGVELQDGALVNAQSLGEVRALAEGKALPTQTGAPEHSYPRWPWSLPARAFRLAFLELVLQPLVRLLAKPRVVRATAKLPPGPFLVVANHVTAFDAALVLYALPGRLRRRMAIAMSGELLLDFRRGRNQGKAWRNVLAPAAYWLMTALLNVFPLPQLRGFRKSFAHAGQAMDQGYSVLLFPEGSRSQDGRLLPFRPGVGLLARESRVPVLPVALLGLAEVRAEGSGWFRSGRIEVRIGVPIEVEEGADASELTSRLEESVRKLQS